MKTIIIMLCLEYIGLFSGCQSIYSEKDYFEGVWIDYKPNQIMEEYKAQFRFKQDSFHYNYYLATDATTCFGTFEYEIEAKGTYKISGNYLYLKWFWTDASLRKLSNSQCYFTDSVNAIYKYELRHEGKLILHRYSPYYPDYYLLPNGLELQKQQWF